MKLNIVVTSIFALGLLVVGCSPPTPTPTPPYWYGDTDMDGYGDPSVYLQQQTQPDGYVSNFADCDDSNPDIKPFPYAFEVPDGVDNDCDGWIDEPHYIKISATGVELDDVAAEWDCVKDPETGLIWEVRTNDDGLRDEDWTYSWYDSNPATNGGFEGYPDNADNCYYSDRCDTEKYVEDVNTVGLCGASDWRMPEIEELAGLLPCLSPNCMGRLAIDTGYFPNSVGYYGFYWSATPYGTGAYVASFLGGHANGTSSKSYSDTVRLVRASP